MSTVSQKVSSMTVADCIEKLVLMRQSHVLRFYEELDGEQKCVLENDLLNIDFLEFNKCMESFCEIKESVCNELEPVEEGIVDGFGYSSEEELKAFYDRGLWLISEGKIAVVILAGGQGTRLGVDIPKGMFDIGLPSHKTLIQIQIERLIRLIHLANEKFPHKNASVTFFIMTSDFTKQAMEEFLISNNYFGYRKEDIIFVEQKALPCVSLDTRKILMKEKHKLSFSPNGNGGFYDALAEDIVMLDTIRERNITGIHVCCVDNVLVKVADPWFVGCCDMKDVDCGNKVTEKEDPTESMGVVCKVGGLHKVVEYSEMPSQYSLLRDERNKKASL